MHDLSVIITARNEEFLPQTIESVFRAAQANTEIIVILDGYDYWIDLWERPGLTVIRHDKSEGQRQSINEAARLSTAKYIMKLDAHCDLDPGFDIKLMANIERDWMVVPRMYNLHVFDWKCSKCGALTYQNSKPKRCMIRDPKDPHGENVFINAACDNTTDFEKVILWRVRYEKPAKDFMMFDKDLHYQDWRKYRDSYAEYEQRPMAQPTIADQMCCIGACWMYDRERYWELGGLDEGHGSWGQMGVELACKNWLSGGRQVVNRRTWFAHLFRTHKDFQWPYPTPDGAYHYKARDYSQKLWYNNAWAQQMHPLSWLVDRFAPVPTWENAKK
jgi:glycosyltransferase involved in cell wall biosynthesis